MKVAFCRKAEKMTELEYICPLAHCVNLTWYAGGLLYFAGKESDRVTLYYTHLGGKPDKTPSVFGFSDMNEFGGWRNL